MKPFKVDTITTVSADALDTNGVSLSQQPAAGGEQELTITGTLAANGAVAFNLAQRVGITSAGDDSGRTFTFTGTTRSGLAQVEEVTGANAGLAVTLKDFLSITSVTSDANTAGVVEVGPTGVFGSEWFEINPNVNPINVGFAVDISGTINFDIEQTYGDPSEDEQAQVAGTVPIWFKHARVVSESIDQYDSITTPVRAIRLVVNSFTAGATIGMNGVQAGAPDTPA